MAELTPMMKQYFEIKNKNKDYILFYRVAISTRCFLMTPNLFPANWNSR